MATSDEGGRGGGTRRACDHRSAHVVSGATMVPLHCRTRLNRAYGQPAVGVGTPIVFALPRYREGIRPHLRRGVVVGAETARVGGLQRLAIVSRRKVVDGVLAQPCVQARGKTPHGGGDRGSSSLTRARGSLPALGRTFSSRGTHSNVSRKPPSICASRRATARACGEGLGDPPETNSPNRLPPSGRQEPLAELAEPLAAQWFGAHGERGHRAARHEHAAEGNHGVPCEEGAGGHDKGQHAPQLPQGGAIVPHQPPGGVRRHELDPATGSLDELVAGHALMGRPAYGRDDG